VNRTQKRIWLYGLIAIAVIIFLTVIAAPFSNIHSRGSTYNRSPDGYGAWYSQMQAKGSKIQRLQKPLQTLFQETTSPVTLVRIDPSLAAENALMVEEMENWLKKGNRLILLGVNQPVTDAPYQNSVDGVQIDSRRRNRQKSDQALLQDNYGAILWREEVGRGEIIYSTTPYLGANAYQDFPANYQLLSELVTGKNQSIWVDEYIHGYRDADNIQPSSKSSVYESLGSYLLKTPLFPLAIQGIIILGLAIWGLNHRLRRPTPLITPTVNNSEAYIQALASVLHKAERSEFVIEQLTPAEQLDIQKQLGVGNTLLDSQGFLELLQEHHISTRNFKSLLHPPKNTDLQAWLDKWQKIRSFL